MSRMNVSAFSVPRNSAYDRPWMGFIRTVDKLRGSGLSPDLSCELPLIVSLAFATL